MDKGKERVQNINYFLAYTVHGGLCLEIISEHLIFAPECPRDQVMTKHTVAFIIMLYAFCGKNR